MAKKPQTLKAQVASVTVIRDRLAAFLGFSHNGARDLYASFGYPRILKLEDLEAMYKRGGIAKRIIRAYPQATWRDCPIVKDDSKGEEPGAFEKAASDFMKNFHVNWYMERTDRLANLGEYALLLMGFEGKDSLEAPITGMPKLAYLSPYKQIACTIDLYDLDETSERFGMPLFYKIRKDNNSFGQTIATKTIRVHYSRILHVADGVDDNEVFGVPRLQAIFNHLMDLQKVVGAGAETFWLNAKPGTSLEADKDARLSDSAIQDMEKQAEEYEHQLRRIFALQGVKVNQLSSAIADPTSNIDAILQLIAGTEGIPKRILTGSEQGELASSQDENNWNSRIEERRENFATPMMLKPFIQKMVDTGNLPKPNGEICIEWPEISALSPKDKAEIAGIKAKAVNDYEAQPGAQLTVPPQEFRQWIGEDAVSEYEPPELPPLPEPDPNAPQPGLPGAKPPTPAQQTFNNLRTQRRKAVRSVT